MTVIRFAFIFVPILFVIKGNFAITNRSRLGSFNVSRFSFRRNAKGGSMEADKNSKAFGRERNGDYAPHAALLHDGILFFF